jgi:hypothetical protein
VHELAKQNKKNKTKQPTKQNKTNNKTKQNKQQNKTKQNKTKQQNRPLLEHVNGTNFIGAATTYIAVGWNFD